jgi:hypothetical protein
MYNACVYSLKKLVRKLELEVIFENVCDKNIFLS